MNDLSSTSEHRVGFEPTIRSKLRQQLEYYFSKDNLINDIYLQSQMDNENYVFISIIANFKLVKRLTNDLQMIIDVLKEMPSVEVNGDENKVRSSDQSTYQYNRKRCVIILRNVPTDATESEVSELFVPEHCALNGPVQYERVLQSNQNDCWYVKFTSEDDAQKAFLYLTRENVLIRGQKILARLKSQLWQRSSEKNSPAPTISSSQTRPPLVYLQPSLLGYPNVSNGFSPRTAPLFQSHYVSSPYPSYRPMTHVHPLIGHYSMYPSTGYWFLPSVTDSSSPTIVSLQSFVRNHNGAQGKKSSRQQRETTLPSKSTVEQSSTNDQDDRSKDENPVRTYADTVKLPEHD